MTDLTIRTREVPTFIQAVRFGIELARQCPGLTDTEIDSALDMTKSYLIDRPCPLGWFQGSGWKFDEAAYQTHKRVRQLARHKINPEGNPA